MDSPTTPTFLSDPEAPPPTKPVVYSPVPTCKTRVEPAAAAGGAGGRTIKTLSSSIASRRAAAWPIGNGARTAQAGRAGRARDAGGLVCAGRANTWSSVDRTDTSRRRKGETRAGWSSLAWLLSHLEGKAGPRVFDTRPPWLVESRQKAPSGKIGGERGAGQASFGSTEAAKWHLHNQLALSGSRSCRRGAPLLSVRANERAPVPGNVPWFILTAPFPLAIIGNGRQSTRPISQRPVWRRWATTCRILERARAVPVRRSVLAQALASPRPRRPFLACRRADGVSTGRSAESRSAS